MEPISVSDQQHSTTPGPWVVHQRNHRDGDLWLDIGYRLPDGTERGPICDITGRRYVEPHACDHRSVAEIKYLVTPEGEQWANARLIAAAPMLLEALERALAQTADGLHESPCDVPDCWIEAAQVALDAARQPAAGGEGS
jgi:hypothetical protein